MRCISLCIDDVDKVEENSSSGVGDGGDGNGDCDAYGDNVDDDDDGDVDGVNGDSGGDGDGDGNDGDDDAVTSDCEVVGVTTKPLVALEWVQTVYIDGHVINVLFTLMSYTH